MLKYHSFIKNFTVLVIILSFFISPEVFAQTNPINEKGFSFQGYARDFEGNALGSANVRVQFSIYEEGNPTSPEFEEVHDLTTDAFGVFAAIVGSENTAQFFGIDWVNKNYFLRAGVSVNNTDFVTVSETQLLSVPYAQAAGRAQNGVPAGSITAFAGDVDSNLPEGYLVCDGSLKNIADFPELFAAIGTSWGGDGGSTFRMPDLRGRFLRGVSGDSDVDPVKDARISINDSNDGNQIGSYQNDAFRSHNHAMETAGSHRHNVTFGNTGTGDGRAQEASQGNNGTYPTENAGNHTHTINNSGGAETRPVNANVHYIIKF